MTDEEKAEEYADKILSDPDTPFLFSEREVKAYIIKVYLDFLKCAENAYNKGLEEGKPKWHDLRKDPNDLPKHSGLYCTQGGEVREFDKEELSWFTVHFVPCMNCTEDTYAWCEIPKFKE